MDTDRQTHIHACIQAHIHIHYTTCHQNLTDMFAMYVCMFVCLYACMYSWMYAWMYACMHACMHVYILYIYIQF